MWYLDNKRWNDITREERVFTAELYFCARENPKPLIKLFGLTDSKHYEVGFEVCLYRDLLFYHNKKSNNRIKTVKEEGLPPKRTFDLVLMAEDEFVIIEAKAAQNFSKTDRDHYLADRDYIKQVFELCYGKKLGDDVVKICGICSTNNGKMERDKGFFEGGGGKLVTWKDVKTIYPKSEDLFMRANKVHR